MEKEQMRNLLDQAISAMEKEKVVENFKDEIVTNAKLQMKFMEGEIKSDDKLTDDEKKRLLKKLNIEAIRLDVKF